MHSQNLALAFHEQVSTLLRSTDETVQMNAVQVSQLPFVSWSKLTFARRQTLIPLLHSLSTRNYDQHSTDLSSILSGNLERSDAVFSVRPRSLFRDCSANADPVFQDFVSAIDRILNNTAASSASALGCSELCNQRSETDLRSSAVALCRRTLQLALLVVASSNQASLNAYFMRRDLFSTLVKVSSSSTLLHSRADILDWL